MGQWTLLGSGDGLEKDKASRPWVLVGCPGASAPAPVLQPTITLGDASQKSWRWELEKTKGCLENPRSLHTVSPSLHRSCAGETVAWSLAPPAQAMQDAARQPWVSWSQPGAAPGCLWSLLCSPLSVPFLCLFAAQNHQ